jgi:hypothetical protein
MHDFTTFSFPSSSLSPFEFRFICLQTQNSKRSFLPHFYFSLWIFSALRITNDLNNSQNAWLYLTIGLLFILGSSLIIHMVFFAEEFSWVAKYTKDTLFVSAVSRISFVSTLSNANFIPLLFIRSSAIVVH